MSMALRSAGHVVEASEGAREALRRLEDCPTDLLITDLVMEDMDGIELLRRVKERWPETAVITISGAYHGTMYLRMAKLIGAQQILAKPFSSEHLLAAVADVCCRAEARQPSLRPGRA